jgi:hypothetical protein
VGVNDPTDEALRALAEPRRRDILRLVARDELAAGGDRGRVRREQDRDQPARDRAQERGTARRAARRDAAALPRAAGGLAGLREFLDEMWAGALDTARRLVEAERGVTDARTDDAADRAG